MTIALLTALIARTSAAHASGFSWFQLLPGMSGENALGETLGLADPHEAYIIPTTWAVVGVLLGLAYLARRGLDRARARPEKERYLPDSGFSLRNIFEVITTFLWDMLESNMGKKEAKAFFPLVGALFTYILLANLGGFIPGFLPPTDNFSSNFALALTVFLVFNYAGFARNGLGYLKHLAGPVWWLAPAFFVLETVSLFIRPLSLTIRLTVNIFVDHMLQTIARDLGGLMGVVGAVVLPVPLYFLGLLVCVIQAFIFALLTTIYISQSVAHEEHGGHDDHHAHH